MAVATSGDYNFEAKVVVAILWAQLCFKVVAVNTWPRKRVQFCPFAYTARLCSAATRTSISEECLRAK